MSNSHQASKLISSNLHPYLCCVMSLSALLRKMSLPNTGRPQWRITMLKISQFPTQPTLLRQSPRNRSRRIMCLLWRTTHKTGSSTNKMKNAKKGTICARPVQLLVSNVSRSVVCCAAKWAQIIWLICSSSQLGPLMPQSRCNSLSTRAICLSIRLPLRPNNTCLH